MLNLKGKILKRLKLKWIAIGVVLLVPLFLGVVWLVGQSSLSRQLAALRAEGMPTNLNELNDFYAVPEGVEDTTDLWLKAFDAVEKAGLFNRGKDLPIIGYGPTPIPPPGEEWAAFEAARTFIKELESELQALHIASDACGQVRFPVDLSNLGGYALTFNQKARSADGLLSLAMHVHAHDDKAEECLRNLRSLFGLSNAYSGEVMLVHYIVQIAFHRMACDAVERMLPVCEWSDNDLASLQKTVRSANFRDELTFAFQGERAYSLGAIELLPFTYSPFRTTNKLEILRAFELTLGGLSKSWQEALQGQRELSTQNASITRNPFSRIKYASTLMLMQSNEQVIILGADAEARQRCTNAAIAARRYQLKHGALPNSLADIEQELLGPESESSASLIDPFDGQPLRYIVEEDRVLIYSIGENEQDDGGDCERGDSQTRPLDVGFYLKK